MAVQESYESMSSTSSIEELASREHNLAVVDEAIKKDPKNGALLAEVRDMLSRRVTKLRKEITSNS